MTKSLGWILFALATAGAPAHAQLFRAYLASTGSDANPCTRQQPCRLLPAALAATATGGEVWMLDSANYNVGPVLVDRSVDIVAVPGAVGSVVGNGGDALEINGPGATVTLRNLVVLNLSGGSVGVRFTAGVGLRVEGCQVHGFSSAGIFLNAPAATVVVDSIVRDNAQGVVLDNGAKATISRTHLVGNATAGLSIGPTAGAESTAHVTDSVLNHNGYGIFILGSANRFAIVHLRRSMVSGNANSGVYVQGVNQANDLGSLHLSSSTINRNPKGIEIVNGAVFSAGDNRVTNNTVDRTNLNNAGTFLLVPST